MMESDFDKHRFRTLLGFGKFFSLLGWVIVFGGAFLVSLGMGQFGLRSGMGGGIIPTGPAMLVFGVGLILYGFVMVASGQFISCFVSLESNTYVTKLLQQNILKTLRDQLASYSHQVDVPTTTAQEG